MGLRTFAYLRVSTADQHTDNELNEIVGAGFYVEPHRIVAETVSGSMAAMERQGFKKLVDRLEASDVLIVTKLDRLGRNAMDVRTTVERLDRMGVKVHCLALGGVDLTSAAGRMTMAVISAVSEMERDLLIERTRSGLQRAKAEGKKLGRKPKLTATDRSKIMALKADGASLASMALTFGVSRSAIQHAIRSYTGVGREVRVEFSAGEDVWEILVLCSKESLPSHKERTMNSVTARAEGNAHFRAIEVATGEAIDTWRGPDSAQ
jgi:putative DNA-invertase from lambdoid prophage Rac